VTSTGSDTGADSGARSSDRLRAPDASGSILPAPRERRPGSRIGGSLLGRLRLAAGVLFGLQGVVLITMATVLYDRFNESVDTAIFVQAWSQIGSGHLDPWNSVQGFPYWRSHFELIMWPLGLLHPIFGSPLTLLVLQALALAGAGLVVALWTAEVVATQVRAGRLGWRLGSWIWLGIALLLLVNPVTFTVVALDFHFEAFGALFALLTAFALWRGRRAQALGWAAACLLCGDLGGLYLLGVGLSMALVVRREWRTALVLAGGAVGWLGLISALHANIGSQINAYAYLADLPALPTGPGAATALVRGVLAHPGRPLHMLWNRRTSIWAYIYPGGIVGVVWPVALGVGGLTLLSSGLSGSPVFLGEAFQNFPVEPFLILGTAVVLVVAVTGSPRRWLWARRALVAAVAVPGVLAIAAVNASAQLPTVATHNSAACVIVRPVAATLAQVLTETPGDDAVVASQPIMGRFAERQQIGWFDPTHPATLRRPTVVVLSTTYTLQLASPAQDQAAIQAMVHAGGRMLANRSGVLAARWRPTPAHPTVTLP
jgi:hypothetical protein